MTRHFSQRFLRKMIIVSVAAAPPQTAVAVAAYGAVAIQWMAAVIESAQCC